MESLIPASDETATTLKDETGAGRNERSIRAGVRRIGRKPTEPADVCVRLCEVLRHGIKDKNRVAILGRKAKERDTAHLSIHRSDR